MASSAAKIPPVTPVGCLSSHIVTSKESEGADERTPLHVHTYATSEQFNVLWESLGPENNKDMVTAELDHWLEHYAPFQISEEELSLCMERMSSEQNDVVVKVTQPNRENVVVGATQPNKENVAVEATQPNKKAVSYKWSPSTFPRKPSQSPASERDYFKSFDTVFECVCRADVRPNDRQPNGLVYVDCSYCDLVSDIVGVNHRVGSAMVDKAHARDFPLHASHKCVIGDFKKKLTVGDRAEVRLQALVASYSTMCDDPRRMWIYAITVEDDQATLWYFSRSHSAKSMSFNWYENPELLVRVFLVFAYATKEELGIDPRVRQFPEPGNKEGTGTGGSEKAGTEQSEGTGQQNTQVQAKAKLCYYYVYEFPPPLEAEGTDAGTNSSEEKKTRYFRTVGTISEQPTSRIRSRFTRVWKVVEVAGFEPEHHQDPGKRIDGPFALKEACLDSGVPTEVDNQAKLFAAVDDFIKQPTRPWIEDPRLKDFTEDMKEKLKCLFQEGKYKSLFLDAMVDTVGLTTKEGCPQAWPSRGVFKPVPPTPGKSGATSRTATGTSHHSTPKFDADLDNCIKVTGNRNQSGNTNQNNNANANDTSKPNENAVPEAGAPAPPAETVVGTEKLGASAPRDYASKRQARFVYKEVCTSLYDVETFGDVMKIFDESLVALQVMFCAGWVHRDISPGNLLVYKGKVKLADLEYAKPYPDNERKVTWDPKTGTPDFMPNEILEGKLCIEDIRHAYLSIREKAKIEMMIAEEGPTPTLLTQLFNIKPGSLPEGVPLVLPNEDEKPFHNFQHDIESTWWCALWFITRRAGHAPSIESVRKVFAGSLERSLQRKHALEGLHCNGRNLHHAILSQLSPFVIPLDDLRSRLIQESIARVFTDGLLDPGSYSRIHADASRAFKEILADNGEWTSLPLSPLDSTARPPRKDMLKRPNDGPLDREEGNGEDDDSRSSSPTPRSRSTPATPMILTPNALQGRLHKKQRRD